MSYRIVTNQKNRNATLLFTGSNTVTLVGNSSTSAIAIGDEVITGAYISKIWSGCAPDSWFDIQRGANTVCVATTSAFMDFSGNGCAITLDPAADLVVTLNGVSGGLKGTLMIELRKIGTGSSDY
jgi:hypothetical protein